MSGDEILQRVRGIAMSLPRVTERTSQGAPAWFVGRSPQLAHDRDHHHGVDWIAVWAACPAGVRDGLVHADPQTYFVPPYVGARGWVGMRLDDATDWDAVRALLEDAHETVAR